MTMKRASARPSRIAIARFRLTPSTVSMRSSRRRSVRSIPIASDWNCLAAERVWPDLAPLLVSLRIAINLCASAQATRMRTHTQNEECGLLERMWRRAGCVARRSTWLLSERQGRYSSEMRIYFGRAHTLLSQRPRLAREGASCSKTSTACCLASHR